MGTEIRGGNVFLPRLERLDRSALQALQLRKLQDQLLRAHSGNPFYRTLWNQSGFDAAAGVRSLADIRRLQELVVARAHRVASCSGIFSTIIRERLSASHRSVCSSMPR